MHAHIMSGTISPLLSQLVDPQTRRSFSRPIQPWRLGGQDLCFSDYMLLSIRQTGAQQ